MTAAIEISSLERDYNFNCPSCAVRLGWVTPEGELRFETGAKPWITCEKHRIEQSKIYDRGLFPAYNRQRHGEKLMFEILSGKCHQCETLLHSAIVPMRERGPHGLCSPRKPKFARALRLNTGETWLVITRMSAFGPRREHMFGPYTLDGRCDDPNAVSELRLLSIAASKDPSIWWSQFISHRWAELWTIAPKRQPARSGGRV
ncbi:hypothetical protein [Ruegeria sp. SCP11]|uniref:hypothetical protein n=1 Tax=Ruegeria sp. SCP11 TaxID=3141378 RepID=UPI00333933D5